MEKKKLTKKDYFDMIMEVCADNADIVAFCEHEKELLSRKNSKSTTTKTQVENEKIGAMLVEELAKIGKMVTITDLMSESEVIQNYVLDNGKHLTNQKINAIFIQLVKNDTIKRVVDKKKTYFTV